MKEQIEFMGSTESCIRRRRTYVYDEKGNRTETLEWGSRLARNASNATGAGSLRVKQIFKHDALGRRTQLSDYDASGKLESETNYSYDDKGRVSRMVSDYRTCVLKYNAEGLIAEETCERQSSGFDEKTTDKFTYDVDSRGNWVKRVTSSTAISFGKKVNRGGRIAYRSIEYFSGDRSADTNESAGFQFGNIAPCPPMVIRKSGGVFQQSATKRVAPPYPREAKEKRVSGPVVVEVSTDEDGKVVSVRAVSGAAELRGASEEAARQWEFTPTTLSKIPVRVIGTITFNFSL
jgi:TonB family protein